MKFNEFNFPYPVLGLSDSILSACDLKKQILFDQLKPDYEINLEFKMDNADLLKLIEKEQVEYVSEITCSATMFRTVYRSKSSKISFTIPKNSVRGKVEIDCILIAKNEIIEYTNLDMHSDYSDFTFSIDKGDVLGHFKSFSFNADVKYHKLKAVTSFMEIEGEDVTFMNIILENPKIIVQIPIEDYKLFKKDIISRNSKYTPIIHSSIVNNALLTALYNIENNDQVWAEVIRQRMKEEEFNHLSLDDKSKFSEIAQRLLGNPVNRLMVGLDMLVNRSNSDE